MKKEKQPKVKKIDGVKQKKKLNVGSLFAAGISLCLSVALFFGLIYLQDRFSEDIVYQDVIVARTDIPENTILTAENAGTYLTMKSINIANIPAGSLSSADTLLGQQTKVDLVAGEIICLKDFDNINVYVDNLEDPIELSIALGSVQDTDGGKIRTGDLINIMMVTTAEDLTTQISVDNNSASSIEVSSTETYIEPISDEPASIEVAEEDAAVTEEGDETEEASEEVTEPVAEAPVEDKAEEVVTTEEPIIDTIYESATGYKIHKRNYSSYVSYIVENLYVYKALDSSGAEIDPTDTTSNVAIIVVRIEKADEPDLYSALISSSDMKVSKILQKTAAKNTVVTEVSSDISETANVAETAEEETTEE